MKKLMLFAVVFSLMAVSAFADMVVSPKALPKSAQDFLADNFPDTGIMLVEQDYDEFEVHLNNGAEIDFYPDGSWKEVKAYQNFPTKILPVPVVNAISKSQPGTSIIKAEKIWNGYEIKTSNRMELYIDSKGNMLGQKFDH